MVLSTSEHAGLSDVIFMIEGTAVNGAYINDLKTNYIIPALEYFRHGSFDEMNYLSASANTLYGIVVYQASDCLPNPSTDTIGPFSSSSKVLNAIERLELIGGRAESHANIGEGLATALDCFEELQQKREANSNAQKHCIIVCNSPPYAIPVMENHTYSGKTAEQLAALLQEMGINLSIISPRKIPSLYKLYEKAGGDLTASQGKNYAKDPRHLVLLKGFSLKERPISPQGSSNQPVLSTALPLPSLPSPLASNDSPISTVNAQTTQNMLGSNVNTGVGGQPVGQQPVYRPQNPQGITQLPTHTQSMSTQGMVNVGMVNAARGGMMGNTQFTNQPMQAPPGYHAATVGIPGTNRPQNRWPMLPPQAQQKSYLTQPQQVNTTQSSALIAQLTQPPSSMSAPGVNQFAQINNNPQQLRLNMLGNQATPQNVQAQQGQQNVAPVGINQPPSISSVGMPQNTNLPQGAPPNQAVTSQQQQQPQAVGGQSNQQPMVGARERQTIWQGLLEWIEKPKNSNDPQKITRHVPCQVSVNIKDGEPELKAEGWPSKLIMQLMPKQLIGNIGGAYLKNSKSVLFYPQTCEALDSLTKVMSSGFAGCVHFNSVSNLNPCDIKVLILLYTNEKRAYLGFIPNDQAAFVDRLRKVIQQQKSSQMQRQGQGGATQSVVSSSMGGNVGTPPQLPVSNPTSQTTTQQGLMMSQTNTMAMGGGQLTQNIVSSSSPSGMGGMIGQNVPAGMQPRLRMQGIPQVSSSQVNQPQGNPSGMTSGMMGAPLQRPPFDNNLEAARLQNLEKINQLKQTLEAAQQQEQQYKSQLEIISHMKTSQLQEALQVAQQQEMQYKILDQQRMAVTANQSGPQNPQVQQQRIMRPMINTNNPGLRHLLQQQPQYRQQLMGMQGGIGGTGARPQMNQQMQNNPNNPQQPFDDVGNFDFM